MTLFRALSSTLHDTLREARCALLFNDWGRHAQIRNFILLFFFFIILLLAFSLRLEFIVELEKDGAQAQLTIVAQLVERLELAAVQITILQVKYGLRFDVEHGRPAYIVARHVDRVHAFVVVEGLATLLDLSQNTLRFPLILFRYDALICLILTPLRDGLVVRERQVLSLVTIHAVYLTVLPLEIVLVVDDEAARVMHKIHVSLEVERGVHSLLGAHNQLVHLEVKIN